MIHRWTPVAALALAAYFVPALWAIALPVALVMAERQLAERYP